jgi:hypothetical protein
MSDSSVCPFLVELQLRTTTTHDSACGDWDPDTADVHVSKIIRHDVPANLKSDYVHANGEVPTSFFFQLEYVNEDLPCGGCCIEDRVVISARLVRKREILSIASEFHIWQTATAYSSSHGEDGNASSNTSDDG